MRDAGCQVFFAEFLSPEKRKTRSEQRVPRNQNRRSSSAYRVSRITDCASHLAYLHLDKLLVKFNFDVFLIIGILLKNKYISKLLEDKLLPFVDKPARYLGNELNVIYKPVSKIDLRFAIAFPEVYEIAMSSQAINILYHQLNKHESVWAERVFAPWTDAEAKLRQNKIPLFSLESFSPLKDFDIIGFTLQYELTYTNILNMLDLAGIPLFSKDRKENDPIILGGGPCSCNPEPLAQFFDVFYIGDAESGISDLCQILIESKKTDKSRQQTLERLSKLRGIYIPSFYRDEYDEKGVYGGLTPLQAQFPRTIQTQIVSELKKDSYPQKPLVPLIEVTHDRLAVEVMRGCTEGCRYCNAGMIYRPIRERNEDDIVRYTTEVLEQTGYEEISFLSLSISDYSNLNSLLRKERKALAGEKINFSFPSMRLDSFSEDIAEFARTIRKSGFTFAPEAGSDRLRKVINKNITDDDLLKATKIAVENGWKTLKFYFMIGLPTETKEDVEEIANLIERVILETRKLGEIRLNVSVSPHSPKSHTPFQWEKQDTKEEFLDKIYLLKDKLHKFKQVKLSWRDPEVSQIECILGRGDRRLAGAIHLAWKKGARFDGWNEHFKYQEWEDAFIESGLDINAYIKEIPINKKLPWDHIDKGITKKFLKKEREKAYREVQTVDCKDGSCFGCGIQRKNGFRELTECYIESEDLSKKIFDKKEDTFAVEKDSIISATPDHQQSTSHHYRIQFSKNGYSKYLGHLDIVRAFERAFRRAKIEVAHSQGFNPRPKLAFSPPLRLGYTSEAEFVDIHVYEKSAAIIKEKLNNALPEGIKILNIIPVQNSIPSLMSSIQATEYQIDVTKHRISNAMIDQFLKKSEIPVDRRVKGKLKTIDIRPYIERIDQHDGVLTVHTRTIEGRTVRINEIITNLFTDHGNGTVSLPVHKTRQLIQTNGSLVTPMEIR